MPTPLAGGAVPDHGLLVQVQAEPVLQLHLLPRRSGQRRPVRAGRRPQRLRLDRASGPRSASCSAAPTRNTLGFELRQDRIDPVGLYATRAPRAPVDHARRRRRRRQRRPLRAERHAVDRHGSARSLGLRYDRYRFDVDAHQPPRTRATSPPASRRPRLSLIFGPWDKTEYFVNAGYGFHSNDARGVTIKVDPTTGDAGRRRHAAGAQQGRGARRCAPRSSRTCSRRSRCGT